MIILKIQLRKNFMKSYGLLLLVCNSRLNIHIFLVFGMEFYVSFFYNKSYFKITKFCYVISFLTNYLFNKARGL